MPLLTVEEYEAYAVAEAELYDELNKATEYFPADAKETDRRCYVDIISDHTKAETQSTKHLNGMDFKIILNFDECGSVDNMIKVYLHELAHISLGHFDDETEGAEREERHEIEAEKLEDKWFGEYLDERLHSN